MPNFFSSLFNPLTFSEQQAQQRAQAIGGQEVFQAAQASQAAQQYQDTVSSATAGEMSALGGLGTAGTYDIPGQTPSAAPTAASITTALNNAVTKGQLSPTVVQQYLTALKSGAGPNEVQAALQTQIPGILNPTGYAAALANDPTYRIESARTAEAQQGLSHEGPMWNEMQQSIMGPIYEGAAGEFSQSVNAINQLAAQGGTARNTAIKEADTMQAMEAANRDRSQQLWQANLELDQYMNNFAEQQVNANEAFVQNLPYGQAYMNNANKLATLIASNVVPSSTKALQAAASLNTPGPYNAATGSSAPAATATGQGNALGSLTLGGIAVLGSTLLGGGGGADSTTNTAGSAVNGATTNTGGTGGINPNLLGLGKGLWNTAGTIASKGASLMGLSGSTPDPSGIGQASAGSSGTAAITGGGGGSSWDPFAGASPSEVQDSGYGDGGGG